MVKAFIEYWNNMQYVYKNNEGYTTKAKNGMY